MTWLWEQPFHLPDLFLVDSCFAVTIGSPSPYLHHRVPLAEKKKEETSVSIINSRMWDSHHK